MYILYEILTKGQSLISHIFYCGIVRYTKNFGVFYLNNNLLLQFTQYGVKYISINIMCLFGVSKNERLEEREADPDYVLPGAETDSETS